MIKSPIVIRNMELKTRIVMPPMATSKARDGAVGQDLVDYYKKRAENPLVGMIITEHSYISPEGMAHPGQVSVSKEEDIEQLRKITDAIHETGTKVTAQINHAGSAAQIGGEPLNIDTMTKEDLERMVVKFADAAQRAVKAGYDAVEVHSAHGYFLNQVYSPLTNHRTDEYGAQSIENRIRLHREVLKAVRERIGDVPLALRLGGCDYTEGGSTIEDACEACRALEEMLDLIDLSGGMCGYMRKDDRSPGYFRDLSGAVKSKVSIPVLVTGGVRTIETAEELLSEGKADLVGVGRALFADPGWDGTAVKK